jgi:galactofuranosylgalactofuranosylrhamnosyl-N-acetylglucosaminyl-diphospho-decaprenol beta-1,5/1,6-galactofuranosyltransferase
MTEPEGPDVTEPEGPDVTEPEGPDVTDPEGPDVTDPESLDVTEPESAAMGRLEADTRSEPAVLGGPGNGPRGGGLSERVVQRVVFPGADLDVVPLYVETNPDRGAAELAAELLAESLGNRDPAPPSPTAIGVAMGETQTAIRFGASMWDHPGEEILPRRSATISEGGRVSFATYFNAFPASYWRRWTTIDSVTLRLRIAGECTIILYRSAAKGHSYPVETINVETDEPRTIERTLSLAPFIDGGWYWFDIVAGPRGTTLIRGEWTVRAEAGPPGRLSLGFTTFNRTDFMVEHLRTLGAATEVAELLDAVYVIDQGTNHVADHPNYADAAKKLADKLRVIRQGNIGGSGGFSRSMDETLRAGESDYLLILDDDIVLEPESILRAATFADLARKPTIVGGHMFSLYDRSVLHAFAESIAPGKWWWESSPNTKARHDFGRRNLRNTPWLHRRAEADYNGWWMCLIPTKIIREIGLAIPVFIKWDDAEYAVRAGAKGYPTVSLPGVAAWHIPWLDKNDALDWQAYYHIRNRVIVALLHSPRKRGGRLAAESGERQLQNLLSMQYSTAALRLMALEDVLSGPDHLHRDLGVKLAQLREFRRPYTDAQSNADLESYPPPRRKAPDNLKTNTTPTNRINLLTKVATGTLHQFRKPRKFQRPQMVLPYQDAAWWVLSKLDSAVVSAPDGMTAAWYRRDRKMFRSLGWRSLVLHVRLMMRWPRLAAEYRAAAAEFTSPEKWRETFEASLGDPPGGS